MYAFNRGVISPLALSRIDLDKNRLFAETQTNWVSRSTGSMTLRPGLEFIQPVFLKSTRSYTVVNLGGAVTHATATGLANDATVYTALLENGGSTVATISIVGSAAQTYEELITEILADFESGWDDDVEVYLEDGNLVFRFVTWGSSSTMDITDTDLFSSLSAYIQIETAVAGQTGIASNAKLIEFIFATNDTAIISLVDSQMRVLVDDTLINPSGSGTTITNGFFSGSLDGWTDADLSTSISSWVSNSGDATKGYMSLLGPARARRRQTVTMTEALIDEDGTQIRIIVERGLITARFGNALGDGSYFQEELGAGTHYINIFPTDDFYIELEASTAYASLVQSIDVVSTGLLIETPWTSTDLRSIRYTQSGDVIFVACDGRQPQKIIRHSEKSWSLAKYLPEDGPFLNTNTTPITLEPSATTGDITVTASASLFKQGHVGALFRVHSGIFIVTGYTSSTSVSAAVLTTLSASTAAAAWEEGAWSDYRGWPTSVAIFQGRLWWFGRGQIWGSESDKYEGFDDTVIGDAGPIIRTIGFGPVDNVSWAINAKRLLVGTQGSEIEIKASSDGEVITPTSFNIDEDGNLGSDDVQAVRVDKDVLFIQRSGYRAYGMSYDGTDYGSVDLMLLSPEIGSPGITKIAVQRQPDTRVHFIRSDGKVALLSYSPLENIISWSLIETDGEIQDAIVLPRTEEDAVYYIVKRLIPDAPGADDDGYVQYVEKMAKESECVGGQLNKQADAFGVYTGSAVTSITSSDVSALAYLEGREVVVWADGIYVGTQTVASETITLSTAARNVVWGLAYTADYKSTKLARTFAELNKRKKINHLGVILKDTHHLGLEYGPDFDNLSQLPQNYSGKNVEVDTIHPDFDDIQFPFAGEHKSDARICLRATAPKPCTVVAATAD